MLISRCPFAFFYRDVSFFSSLVNHYFINSSNEYEYDGKGSFSHIQQHTNGELNINKSNTAYNQTKGNTVAVYGRYGKDPMEFIIQ